VKPRRDRYPGRYFQNTRTSTRVSVLVATGCDRETRRSQSRRSNIILSPRAMVCRPSAGSLFGASMQVVRQTSLHAPGPPRAGAMTDCPSRVRVGADIGPEVFDLLGRQCPVP
jgi:hypothetical protein